MTDAPAPVAEILAARREARPLADLGAATPRDLDAAYTLQRAVARAMGEDPPAGWKIGATTAAMQAYLNLPHPCAGFTPAAGLHDRQGTFRLANHVKPGVECEIGVRLRHALPPGRHERRVIEDSVEHVFAAIEVVDARYGDFTARGAPTLIADSVFHAGGVTGHPASGWPGLDLAAARGRIVVDGALRGEGTGADLLGHPLEALAWLADSGAAHAFGGLRGGQVVFLGSVTPPIWLDGPCEVTVAFDLLGEVRATFA